MAGDGNAEVFTLLLHSGLRWLPGLAGLLLVVLGLVVFFRPQTLKWMWIELRLLGPDLRRLVQDGNPARLPAAERWGLVGVMLVFLALTVILDLRIPLRYDEAYTYMEFARHSFWQAISDYHVFNNHIFHTLLVHLSTRLWGSGWLAIRLPALMATLLLLPGLYALGRRLYDGGIGLAAAGMFAFSPVFILYATSARGYAWVMFFTVWLFLLALRLQTGCDRAAWLVLIVCGALGMWTIPIMVYPLAGVYLWLFFQAVLQRPDGISFLRRVAGLASSGMAMVALTLVLYTPAFGRDWLAGFLTRNEKAVLPLDVFLSNLGIWVRAPFEEWLAGYSGSVIGLLWMGLLLSLLLHARLSRWRTPPFAAVLAAICVILVVQRTEPITRMWSWLASLFFLAGVSGVAGGVHLFLQRRERWQPALPFTFFILGVAASSLALAAQFEPLLQSPGYEAPRVTAYLQSILVPDDVVVVASHTDAMYWYEFEQAGIPENAIRGIKLRPFRRALVIVHPGERETLETVLEETGPDAVFLDLDSTILLQRFADVEVYAVQAVHEGVEKAFP
jgi:hypothetical protein